MGGDRGERHHVGALVVFGLHFQAWGQKLGVGNKKPTKATVKEDHVLFRQAWGAPKRVVPAPASSGVIAGAPV